MREETKTIVFALGICLVCSIVLSGLAAGLNSIQEENKKFDNQRNIVKAFGNDISTLSRPEIEKIYSNQVTSINITLDESIIRGDGKPHNSIDIYEWREIDEKGIVDNESMPSKYAFPVSGKGLWSIMYGYLAIDSDIETIIGISFYAHGETPGLGAEIVKPWFQDQFENKKIYENGLVTNFKVNKPNSINDQYSVDGISGSTITSKGVENLLRQDAELYAKYFFSKLKEI